MNEPIRLLQPTYDELFLSSPKTWFMLAYMFRLAHKFKILWSIVLFVVVRMMNYFTLYKQTANLLFHNQAVLIDRITNSFVRVFGSVYLDVPTRMDSSTTLPLGVFGTKPFPLTRLTHLVSRFCIVSFSFHPGRDSFDKLSLLISNFHKYA